MAATPQTERRLFVRRSTQPPCSVFGPDPLGNRILLTDPLLHVTRTDYDRLNRPSQVTVNYADGVYNPAEPDKDLVTLYHYDGVGNRDLVTNTLGYETQTAVDALNRTFRVTQNPLAGQPQNYQNEWNIVTQYGYNEVGSRVAVTDTLGRVTRNDYDGLNRVTTVTANYVQGAPADEQTNVATSYTYDAVGNRKTATDPLTHVTSWDYDALGHVLTETRPLANVTAYAYDPRGNRTRVTDPRNHATQYGYDALSRNTLTTDTLGQVTQYVYDAGGRRTQEIDPLTHSTTYAYDDADRQTTVTDALTHLARYGYDGLGNRVKLTDARNMITAYWYDGANRLKGVIEHYVNGGNPDQETNVTTEYSYDGLGNRTQIVDAKGHHTNFTYDRLNRLKTEADALSHTTTIHYYPTGPRSMVQDAKNQQTLYLYDALDRLTKVIYSTDGTSEEFRYDAVGNRKVMTDTVGVTQYSYDDLSRLRQVIDPYNQTVGYDYDAAGNRTLITYPDTKQVTYSYNPVNRLESVKDWTNQWTYYGYDAASRPLTATLPNGVTTSYAYDNANRLTGMSHTTGGGSVTLGDYQFAVDAMGNRTAITETLQPAWLGGARRVFTSTQILLPLVANQSQPTIQSSQNPILLPLVSNQWQPSLPSSQNPILLPFLSNVSGGVGQSQTGPTLFPLQPRSRAPGPVPTVALPTPNKTAVPQTAAPGQTRVPTRALVPAQTATPTDQLRLGERQPRTVESLTASSTLTTTFHPVADAYADSAHPTVNHGTETQLQVDRSPTVNSYLRFTVQGLTGILSRVTLKLYATSAQTTGYWAQAVADNTWTETGITYRNAPAIGSAIGFSGAVTANTWTSVDVSSYVTGNGTFSVALSTASSTALNLASREAGANAPQLVVETAPPALEATAIDYTYDPLSRLTRASYTGSSTSTFAYAYDAVGNRSVQTQTITSTLVTTYGYDIANRLTTVNGVTYSWDDNGNLLNDGAKSYGYDQANRLKQVTQGAITTTFAYNGVGDRLQQTVGAATTHYVLDPAAGLTQVLADGTNTYLYGNDRLGQYQAAMQYFGPDALGSVRQIYDASGQVVGNSRYDPFGNVMAQSGATSVFAFAGEQQDATGLTYLRARYYSAAQGRFTTRDSWEGDQLNPLTLNAWNYTNGNPVNLADPSGMTPRRAGICPEPTAGNRNETRARAEYFQLGLYTFVYCGEFHVTAYVFVEETDGYGQPPDFGKQPVGTATNLLDQGQPFRFDLDFIRDVHDNGTGHSGRLCSDKSGYFHGKSYDSDNPTKIEVECGKGQELEAVRDAYKVAAAGANQFDIGAQLYLPYVQLHCKLGQPCSGKLQIHWPGVDVTVRDRGGKIVDYRLDIFTGQGGGLRGNRNGPAGEWSSVNSALGESPRYQGAKGPTPLYQAVQLPPAAIFASPVACGSQDVGVGGL